MRRAPLSVSSIVSRLATACAAALALTAAASAQTPQAAPDYKVVRTVPLGAPDRWDYVVYDPASRRVFVAHGDRVTVVDGRSGVVSGQITGLPGGSHGIAISTADGRGYTDDGDAGVAKSFDLKTLKVQHTIKAQPDADGVIFDRWSRHVFVMDGDSGKLTVVDPTTDRLVATVEIGGKLEYGVADGTGKVFVDGASARQIIRVDARTNKVDARWPIPACESPHGLAMDTVAHRLFASCVNGKLVVVDSQRGSVVATLPIGKGTDAAAYDPRRKLVFSSNGDDGTLTVIRQETPDRYALAATIKTAVTARTLGIDPASGRLYLAAAQVAGGVTARGRPKLVPGSLKLLFLDPVR